MTERRCENCQFWHKGEPQFTYGNCRRYPPVVGFSFNVSPGKWGESGEGRITQTPMATMHPNTHQDDWCGEFQKKGTGDDD